jgi:hypothetical protein
MGTTHPWRGLPGHLACALATAVGTIAAVTAVYSYFYEGWGQGVAAAAGYLAPPVLVVALSAAAMRWPRVGGLVCLAGGCLAGGWWLWRQAAANGVSPIVIQSAVVFFGPILLMGGVFLLDARHRRLLAADGAGAPAPWWRRHYKVALVVGVPILAVVLGPARQLPEMLARYDDGLRGARTIAGNGVTLTWAPEGPGWNQRGPDGGYLSWEAIAQYGGTGAGLCGHLSDDGTALLPVPPRAWRLPTADEVVRSLTRGGTHAGCTWDGRPGHARCARPPDKETPLWAPDQAPIYYLTSDEAGAQHVLGVNYTGGITPHRRTSGAGYRCVKAAPPATR